MKSVDCNPWTAHKGGLVNYHDPYTAKVRTNKGRAFNSVELAEKTLKNADAVVLTTNHMDFDVEFIKKNAKLIVDLRNMVGEKGEKVFKL